jgi:hypothetical protein
MMTTTGPSFGSRYVVPRTEDDVYDNLSQTMISRLRDFLRKQIFAREPEMAQIGA